MRGGLNKISAYLNDEELKLFNTWVAARGVGQSGFIREQLTFEVRPRGAPKGKREQTDKTKSTGKTKAAAGAAKSRSSKRAGEKKADKSAAKKEGWEQQSFLD
jgi:hypothetical protein